MSIGFGYGENAIETLLEKFIHETIETLMENDEYNGRCRKEAEKWELYKQLRLVAVAMADKAVGRRTLYVEKMSKKWSVMRQHCKREEN